MSALGHWVPMRSPGYGAPGPEPGDHSMDRLPGYLDALLAKDVGDGSLLVVPSMEVDDASLGVV